VHDLLQRYGLPSFFSLPERLLLKLFMAIGYRMPAIAIPRMMTKMRSDAGRMVVDGDSQRLGAYVERGKQEGYRININQLGEMVLGEQEAERRLQTYLQDLENPAIEYISIKISTLFSQIQHLAFDHCAQVIAERLAILFRHAMQHTYMDDTGHPRPKMVNLDMEAYDDLHLTVSAFQRALDLPE
jgi:RHH-type proline utilization regulon transcriptional repressor/proline dehydrogenase/delta 1-pyrroline-5-carboxylate dehydrogenase